jgi:hypothetical protein
MRIGWMIHIGFLRNVTRYELRLRIQIHKLDCFVKSLNPVTPENPGLGSGACAGVHKLMK